MSDMSAEDRLRDAARWFAVRRRGVMTVEERALYAVWVSDADNVSAMARLEQAWQTLGAAEHRMIGTRRAPLSVPPSLSRHCTITGSTEGSTTAAHWRSLIRCF